jgi:hypothetical protein
MRTLVTQATRRDIGERFRRAGFLAEVEDQDNCEEIFEVWKVGEDQSVYPPGDTTYYWTDVEVISPASEFKRA